MIQHFTLTKSTSVCCECYGLAQRIISASSKNNSKKKNYSKAALQWCSQEKVLHHIYNLPCSFIEITLRHGRSPVNLLHIFRTPSYKNTSGELLLIIFDIACIMKVKTINNNHRLHLSYGVCFDREQKAKIPISATYNQSKKQWDN